MVLGVHRLCAVVKLILCCYPCLKVYPNGVYWVKMADIKSKDIALKVQKKFFGKVTNKNVAKLFIDDAAGNLLDNVYQLMKRRMPKKDAQKVVKNIIKITVKIGLLNRNDQFDEKETMVAMKCKQHFNSLAMTIVSFHEVDFSYDSNFLVKSFEKGRELLKSLVVNQLSDKSGARIDHIFNAFSDPKLMDEFFKTNDETLVELRSTIVSNIHKLIDDGYL